MADSIDLQKEKEYLSKVIKIIKEIIEKFQNSALASQNNINDLKRFMWEHLTDYTDEERAIALHDVDVDVDILNKRIQGAVRYQAALKTPYFGKVVFYDDLFDELMNIYLGICSVEKDDDFYVYDWRSPISSLFYNYETGPAAYEAPSGMITGDIKEKYQFKIVGGKLIRYFKSDINIDDDYLQDVLASSSSDKMKNIVSTIQREQNEIIRNDNDRYLIVQGVAGSGKTSVAMHRIAYLLYKDSNLNSNNILIFSPSDVFSDYISDVLPELGEQNVLKSTFSDFAKSFLKGIKKIESYSEFLERIYSDKRYRYQSSIFYKMSAEYQNDIETFFEEYQNGITFNNDIVYENRLFSKEELNRLFSEKYCKLTFKERIDRIAESVCLSLNLPVKRYYNMIRQKVCESGNIDFDPIKLYQTFLKSKSLDDESLNFQNKVNYEDIIGLLFLYFKLNDFPNYRYVRHIVIDEAQDYTPFQLDVLERIFDRSSFTILGDINQSINPYYNYASLNELSHIFKNARYLELTKTYRSSEEIIEYTNKILGISNVCSIRKEMNIPVLIKKVSEQELKHNIENDILDMQQHGMNRIAIITKDVRQAVACFEKCNWKNTPNVQLVVNSNNTIEAPIVVIPSYLAKGLEFDGVICYNEYENDYSCDERKLYYVVCTRAQHQLNIYNEPKHILKMQKLN